MLERAAPVAGNRGQARTILGGQNYADILCHNDRIARHQADVNPMKASLH
jgi:hypothetical protein